MHIALDLFAVVCMAISNMFPISAYRQFMLNPPTYNVCVMLMLFCVSGLVA